MNKKRHNHIKQPLINLKASFYFFELTHFRGYLGQKSLRFLGSYFGGFECLILNLTDLYISAKKSNWFITGAK